MTKVKLFHVVGKKMYHAEQTCEINCQSSTKSLIFDLTKILLHICLILIYCLIGKVIHYQILFTGLKSSD